MKVYELETTFGFGKYEGKTVRQILDLQPSYLNWCAITLDHFYISDEVIDEIILIKPNFTMSDIAKNKLNEKYAILIEEYDDDDDDFYDNNSYRSNRETREDTFDALTDGMYGDYDDWLDAGGDMDSLRDGLGF